jgi:hypothetical protein
MYESAPDRPRLAEILGDAFLDGTWRAEDLAERGAGCLDRWPDWMVKLSFAVGLVIASRLWTTALAWSGLSTPFCMIAPLSRRASVCRSSEFSGPDRWQWRTTGRLPGSGRSRGWLSDWS